MRGAGPATPERAGAQPLYPTNALAEAEAQPSRGQAARIAKGISMTTIMRRMPQQRQVTRRTANAGNARQQYERYLARAREARVNGDAVEMENCYQHAEHYFRVLRGEGHERRGDL